MTEIKKNRPKTFKPYEYDPTRANVGSWLGTIAEEPKLSHSLRTKEGKTVNLFKTHIDCERKSGVVDRIPIVYEEGGFPELTEGNFVHIKGNFRSFNERPDGPNGKTKLSLFIHPRFVKKVGQEFQEMQNIVDPNYISLDGFICKPPGKRETPGGAVITDIILAVNRPNRKSDYIPVILWKETAEKFSDLPVGTHIKVKGRVQSRTYKKKVGEDDFVERIAYEVSANKLFLPDEEN